MNFFSKSSKNLPKTRTKKLGKAHNVTKFSNGPDAINGVQYNITSLFLNFNKSVVFWQQNVVFSFKYRFLLE